MRWSTRTKKTLKKKNIKWTAHYGCTRKKDDICVNNYESYMLAMHIISLALIFSQLFFSTGIQSAAWIKKVLFCRMWVANRHFYTLIAFTSPQKNNIGDLAKCEKKMRKWGRRMKTDTQSYSVRMTRFGLHTEAK